MTKLFLIIVDPPERAGAMADLHQLLLGHPSIRDVLSTLAYAYFVKFDGDADELSNLVRVAVTDDQVFTAELHPMRIAGRIPERAIEWMEEAPPPPRHDGHQPDDAALERLPPIAALEPSIVEREIHRLICEPAQGDA